MKERYGEKMKKENKFSVFGNFGFTVKFLRRYARGYFLTRIFYRLVMLATVVFGTYESKLILDALQRDDPLWNIVLIIVAICAIPLVLQFFSSIYRYWNHRILAVNYKKTTLHTIKTLCYADYDKMEDPECKTLYTQYANYASNAPIEFMDNVFELFYLIAVVVVCGTLLTSLHPIIVVILAVMAFVQFLIKKPLARFQQKMNPALVANDRRFNYSTSISRDYANAKEVRIYNMSSWLNDINDECLNEHRRIHSAIQNRVVRMGLCVHSMNFLRDSFAYVYLIIQFANGNMTPGNFVLYFTAITTVSQTLNGFAETLAKINQCNVKISELHKFENFELSRRNHGVGAPIPQNAPEIEFRGVSYRYPNAEEDTIKNISFRIGAGEKIAIVGVNGAGKTTLIKLMCGLYFPTEGEIFVNGKPVSDYNVEEYYSLFSAVFQEVFLLPYSIAEHIAATTDKTKIDRARVLNAIERAGLAEKISSLENGIDTLLDKEVNEGGADFSGGEKQKLSLARAIYLSRPVLVLDEPTSALDPIAENDMYMRFDSNVENKTAIFISHRLASTRFCDRILHIENGRIIENGTHDELMRANGKYRMMYDIQSSYYTDDKKGERHER